MIVDIETRCKCCNDRLEHRIAHLKGEKNNKYNTVIDVTIDIELCKTCLENAKEEGIEEAMGELKND